jgi:hypothetical protein
MGEEGAEEGAEEGGEGEALPARFAFFNLALLFWNQI